MSELCLCFPELLTFSSYFQFLFRKKYGHFPVGIHLRCNFFMRCLLVNLEYYSFLPLPPLPWSVHFAAISFLSLKDYVIEIQQPENAVKCLLCKNSDEFIRISKSLPWPLYHSRFSLLSKIRTFLSFQLVHQTSVTIELQIYIFPFSIPLMHQHRSSSFIILGIGQWIPTMIRMRSQICLVNEQRMKR